MADPSIVIEPSTNTWQSNRSISLKRSTRRYLHKSKHRKMGSYISSSPSFSSSSSSSCLHLKEAGSQINQNISKRRGDTDLLLLPLVILLKTMVGSIDLDIPLLRLLTFIQPCSLIGLQKNHRIQTDIRIQDRILNRILGPLKKLSIKSSDYYRKKCVLDLQKIIHPSKLNREALLMEYRSTPLPVLPQSKLIEKYYRVYP